MIEYFELNEKKIPVRITRKTLIAFEKKSGQGLQSLSNLDTQSLTDLVFAGIVEGYLFMKEINPYKNQDDFENDVDDNMSIGDFYNKATEVITSFFTEKKKQKK